MVTFIKTYLNFINDFNALLIDVPIQHIIIVRVYNIIRTDQKSFKNYKTQIKINKAILYSSLYIILNTITLLCIVIIICNYIIKISCTIVK